MGWKYTIQAKLNGLCKMHQNIKTTNHITIALFWLIAFRIKYPIVDFMVRNGYENCNKCIHEGLLCKNKTD